MGRMALSEFQDELNAQFGNRGLGNERLTRWINAAYYDLCGMLEFEDLRCQQHFNTTEGSYIYALPENFLSFTSVWDATNKRRIHRLDTQDAGLVDIENEGEPTKWMVRGNALWLIPVPDDEYEIQAVFIKEPTALSAASDTTVLPVFWDFSVLLLAKQYGHLSFNEIEAAQACAQKVVQNLRTRKTDEQWAAKTPMAGLQVAWSESDLTDQQ